MRFKMRLWQKRGWYYIELARGKHKALGTQDKAEAKRIFTIFKREYLAGKLIQLSGECPKTLEEYYSEVTAWFDDNKPRSTARANRLALDKIRTVAGGNIRLDRLTPKHLDQVITASRKKGLSVHSVNNYIRHAKASLIKAVDWGYLKANPFRTVREIRVDKSPPKAIPAADLNRLLAAITDPELKSLAAAYVVTGRRRKELFHLRWEDINFEAGTYRVVAKGGDTQTFPLTDAFRTILEPISARTGRVWPRWKHIDTVTKRIKKALCAAGLGDSHLHDLRHSYARMFLECGGDLRELQDLLGHAEYRTTERYGSLSLEHLKRTAERVKLPTGIKAVK